MFRLEHRSTGAQEHRIAQFSCLCSCALVLWCSFSFSSDAWGAAAVQRIRDQKAAMEAAVVQQQYQQAVAERQAQIAAYQQAQVMAYRQAQMQQAAYQKAAMEYAAYKQAMQMAVAKRNAEIQAANQLKQMIAQKQAQQVAQVQQAVVHKQVSEIVAYKQARQQQAMAEATAQVAVNQQVNEYVKYLAVRKQALAQQAVAVQQVKEAQTMTAYNAYQKAAVEQQRAAIQVRTGAEAMQRAAGSKIARDVLTARDQDEAARQAARGPQDDGETVVDITDLWNSLDRSSLAWAQVVDDEIKLLTVSEYIDRFGKLGVKIRKPPGGYAQFIDALALQDPGFLDAPFMNVLSYAAIVEYDFENGKNKDELARQVLGEEGFRANKQRIEAR
jgi:hypothetical protein